MSVLTGLAAASLVIWIYLLSARGGFWLARERDDRKVSDMPLQTPAAWPSVAIVIPARNEAASIAQVVGSLCRQDYAGVFQIVVVDDQSDDGTAALARAVARQAVEAGAHRSLEVLRGAPLPSGWTGKLWAVHQGIAFACADGRGPDWLWLTDADIVHAPDNLRSLVARAVADDRVLVSLMAKLRCSAWFERALIPAFVLFFQMLYPFAWVNRCSHRMAAAAGGCMLVRREALEAAGGIEAIRAEVIDDCALGTLMKTRGGIWLGLTNRAVSVRPYDSLCEIGRMVSRTAFAQLKYSAVWLAGTVALLLLTFVAPPVLTLVGGGTAQSLAALAWLAMTLACVPMLRFYCVGLWRAPLLPVVAAFYAVFTVDSAIQYWRGRGGMWKGRAQAPRRPKSSSTARRP